jgi:leucyl aminopeptidase
MTSPSPHPGADAAAYQIHLVTPPIWLEKAESRSESVVRQADRARFTGKAGELLTVAAADGGLEAVYFGLGDKPTAMAVRGLAARAPAGPCRIASAPEGFDLELARLAFALGAYKFEGYRREREAPPSPRLEGDAPAWVGVQAAACALARDLVNTPASHLGPAEVESAARALAEKHAAAISVCAGDDLLEANYPLVHAVGRAAAPERAPRLIEMHWGEASHPLVALVGKGVTFDTGGLDLKPSAAMRLMKKDMGGAAHVLALADMIMGLRLPVRLAVLVAAVENSVSGAAMRPGDVYVARNGLGVEIGNTDAEGRLILADALTRAGELEPVLTLDMATLTGAARIALGPEVVPFYTDDEDLAAAIAAASRAVEDPLWRMPLWPGYAAAIESDIADIKNDSDAWAQAGSVTAALFLKRFAPKGAWVHLDIFAWNSRGRPGWPAGGEAQAIRALCRVIADRFG